jgi:hypothetical protein
VKDMLSDIKKEKSAKKTDGKGGNKKILKNQ